MAQFKPYKILSTELDNLPILEGQYIITTDDRKQYLDINNTERIAINENNDYEIIYWKSEFYSSENEYDSDGYKTKNYNTLFQEILNKHNMGKDIIIIGKMFDTNCFYIFKGEDTPHTTYKRFDLFSNICNVEKGNNVNSGFSSFNIYRYSLNIYCTDSSYTTIDSVSYTLSAFRSIDYLATNYTGEPVFMPSRDGQPATKKYADSIINKISYANNFFSTTHTSPLSGESKIVNNGQYKYVSFNVLPSTSQNVKDGIKINTGKESVSTLIKLRYKTTSANSRIVIYLRDGIDNSLNYLNYKTGIDDKSEQPVLTSWLLGNNATVSFNCTFADGSEAGEFVEIEFIPTITKQYLSTDNEEEYTPIQDYNPTTKKYVDDKKIARIIDIDSYLIRPSDNSDFNNILSEFDETYNENYYGGYLLSDTEDNNFNDIMSIYEKNDLILKVSYDNIYFILPASGNNYTNHRINSNIIYNSIKDRYYCWSLYIYKDSTNEIEKWNGCVIQKEVNIATQGYVNNKFPVDIYKFDNETTMNNTNPNNGDLGILSGTSLLHPYGFKNTSNFVEIEILNKIRQPINMNIPNGIYYFGSINTAITGMSNAIVTFNKETDKITIIAKLKNNIQETFIYQLNDLGTYYNLISGTVGKKKLFATCNFNEYHLENNSEFSSNIAYYLKPYAIITEVYIYDSYVLPKWKQLLNEGQRFASLDYVNSTRIFTNLEGTTLHLTTNN